MAILLNGMIQAKMVSRMMTVSGSTQFCLKCRIRGLSKNKIRSLDSSQPDGKEHSSSQPAKTSHESAKTMTLLAGHEYIC